jgi:hypothetical protein
MPNTEALAEMTSLATRVRAEAELMRVATRRQAIVYIVLGIVIAGYLSWAYRRAAQYIDADAQAQNTGELALKRSMELVYQAAGEARASAPKVVRGVETTFLAGIPDLGKQLTGSLRDKPQAAIKASLAAYDAAFLDELTRLPDGKKRVAALAANPSGAAKLVADLHPKIQGRADVVASRVVPPSLVEVRDQVRHLSDRNGLNAPEQAERRLLQVVLSKATAATP